MLLSGGCLEVDLVLHARAVVDTGARRKNYDMRGEDDLLFGIGSGCEGAMQVLLQRVGPAENLAAARGHRRLRRIARVRIARARRRRARGRPRAGGTAAANAPWPEPDVVRAARDSLAPETSRGSVAFTAGHEQAARTRDAPARAAGAPRLRRRARTPSRWRATRLRSGLP